MKLRELLEYVKHSDRTQVINGWEVVRTNHGVEREAERLNNDFPGGFEEFVKKVIAKVSTFKEPRDGEYMYKSRKLNQAVIINLDNKAQQIRIITILPKGKDTPKPGTPKVLIEGREIEMIEDYDTDYELAMRAIFEEITSQIPEGNRISFDEFMRQADTSEGDGVA